MELDNDPEGRKRPCCSNVKAGESARMGLTAIAHEGVIGSVGKDKLRIWGRASAAVADKRTDTCICTSLKADEDV